MDPVFPPFLVRDRFARRAKRTPGGFAVPWAVQVPDVQVARALLDQLLQSGVHSGQIVVAGNGTVYVRWTE